MDYPTFDSHVLDVLDILPRKYNAPGLMPSISPIAPRGTEMFFSRLRNLKRQLYPERIQFQFSLHSTDREMRRQLILVKTWDFSEMAGYGKELYAPGGRKITLNFAFIEGVPVNPDILVRHFDPDVPTSR